MTNFYFMVYLLTYDNIQIKCCNHLTFLVHTVVSRSMDFQLSLTMQTGKVFSQMFFQQRELIKSTFLKYNPMLEYIFAHSQI